MHSSTSIVLFLLCLVVTCHGYSTFKTNCSIPSDSVNFVSSPDTRGTLDILFSCLFTIFACTWSIQHLNIPEQRVVKRAAVGAQTDLEMEGEPDQTADESRRVVKRAGVGAQTDLEMEGEPDHTADESRRVVKRAAVGAQTDLEREGEPDQTADESRRGRVRRLPAKTDGFWSDFRWTLKGLWVNVKWMLFTIVAPEFIFGKALADFVCARDSCEMMKSLAECDGVEWGLEYGFYATMGGFVAFEQNDKHQVPDEAQGLPLSSEQIYHLRITKAGTDNDTLDVSDIIGERAQFKTWIERLPDITVAEIHEKSQSNLFVKVITVFQVSWVILQVVVRASKGLSISLLELSVVAFSTCAIIIYIVLLHKPQGTQIPTRIICKHGSISNAQTLKDLGWFPMQRFWNPFDFWIDLDLEAKRRIPNDFVDRGGEGNSVMLGGVILGSAIFGGIHVAGWNLKFPTSTEQTLWRISSLLVTTLLLMSCVVQLILELIILIFKKNRYIVNAWQLLVAMLYILARLFMLIEIIRTLFYLPPDSYISTWASNVPHVS